MSSKNAIPAGQFKARCLALLDRVARSIKPAHQPSLVGSVKTRGDIVGPILDDWELDRRSVSARSDVWR